MLAVSVIACGGGSGSGGGTLPRGASSVSYTTSLVFVGSLAGHGSKVTAARVHSVRPLAVVGTDAIMVVEPITASGLIDGNPANDFGGTAYVEVSPSPATSPSVSFSISTSLATFSTPQPNVTSPPGTLTYYVVTSSTSAPNTQGSGTATAMISDPVDESPSSPVYAYMAIAMNCGSPAPQGDSVGWAWNAGSQSWQAVSNPSQADIYLTGPNCPGAFNQTTGDGYAVLNFPGGGLTISTDNAFSSITASGWANDETSVDMETIDALNGDGSQNTLLIAKTRGGVIFKVFPNIYGPNPGDYAGAIEVSGASIDGF